MEKKYKLPPVVPLDVALQILMPTAEELKQEAHEKKIDANNLTHRHGFQGFLEWLNVQKPIYVHRSDCPAMPLGRIRRQHPNLRPEVIEGLLRRGEIMNIIAAPKQGKSMLVLNLIMSIISGGEFLGRFRCNKGRALVIDNELHLETISHRVPLVAKELNIPLSRADTLIDYVPLRGALVDLIGLERKISGIRPGSYRLIVLDAFYKFMPDGTDENSNADIANLYNRLDKYAKELDSALVLIHHTSKGLQSSREVTDIGAGAGSQSRAADTHLILRPHEEDGAVVVDAATRSFKSPDSFCVRLKFPRWELAPDLKPEDLKGLAGQRERDERKTAKAQDKDKDAQLKAQLAGNIGTPMNVQQLLAQGHALKISRWSKNLCGQWIIQMVGEGKLKQTTPQKGNIGATYVSAIIDMVPEEKIDNQAENIPTQESDVDNSEDGEDVPF